MVVKWGSDKWWWRSSGGGVEGGGEGDLSAVVVARAVELRWIGGGALVDWQWIGGGKVEGVDDIVAVVVKWGLDEWRWRLNYHIVVGGINALTSLSFVTRRAFSCRCAFSHCSVVGLDVNVFGSLDALLPRLLLPLHCHQRCHQRCHCWS